MGMGKYRFRLSDMIPNAWFYKLKDMNNRRKQRAASQNLNKKPSLPRKSTSSQPRNSYYFPTEHRKDKFSCSRTDQRKASDTRVNETPRASYRRRSKRKTVYKPSPNKVAISSSAGCSCHATLDSAWTTSSASDSPDYTISPLESSPEIGFHESLLSDSEEDDGFLVPDTFDHQVASLQCSSCNCRVSGSNNSDIIIDMNDKPFEKKTKKVFSGLDAVSKLELPPILTKPPKFSDEKTEVNMLMKRCSSKTEETRAQKPVSVKAHRAQKITSPVTQSPNRRQGIKLRSNSPRIASRKVQAFARKSVSSARNKALSESFAVEKSSIDPQRDFRDSMMEMIVENDIRTSKDLEELLACYLSLNSQEYHETIIKAFEQIWLHITDLRM